MQIQLLSFLVVKELILPDCEKINQEPVVQSNVS